MFYKLLALISIFLPLITRGSPGVEVRPGPGTYPVNTPITIMLDDVHACAGMWITVDGLEPGEYIGGGSCDTGIGVAEFRVLVPAEVRRVTVTPVWYNGDPCETVDVVTWFEFVK